MVYSLVTTSSFLPLLPLSTILADSLSLYLSLSLMPNRDILLLKKKKNQPIPSHFYLDLNEGHIGKCKIILMVKKKKKKPT